MEHFVTLFDSLFLPQGLALHRSMQRHAGPHVLWILCVDEQVHATLSGMDLPDVRLIALASVETAALRGVKPTRSKAEYCWTLTPFTPLFVFNADPTVRRVTYVDADLWLCRNPAPLLAEFEMSGKGVFITEHAYAPEYDHSRTAGRFCVQFMTFVRGRGERVRTWWADRCIEWCFARVEDGKFGDQRYLDDWPERFPDDVHVLRDRSLLQAPWNSTRFPASEAVAFHFHGLRLLKHRHVLLSENYRIHRITREAIYLPYLADLRSAVQLLREHGLEAMPQLGTSITGMRLRMLGRRMFGWWRSLFWLRIARL